MRKGGPHTTWKSSRSGKMKSVKVHGSAYSLNKLKDLIANLQNEERDVAVKASVEFMGNNKQIMAAAEKEASISINNIINLVLKVVKENEQIIFKTIQETNNIKAAIFLTNSPIIPPSVAKNAVKVLSKVSSKPKTAPSTPYKAQAEKHKETTPATPPVVYNDAKLAAFVKKLKSRNPKQQVSAAMEFLSDNGVIISAISKSPKFKVTYIVNAFRDVLRRNADPIIREILVHWKIKEIKVKKLKFLVNFEGTPAKVKQKALAVLKKLEAQSPRATQSKPQKSKPASDKIKSKPTALVPTVEKQKSPMIQLSKPEPKQTLQSQPTKSAQLSKEKSGPFSKPMEVKQPLSEKPEATVTKKQIFSKAEFPVQRTKQLWKDLNSKDIEKKIKAAIDFFANNHKISTTLAKVPMLTVTQVNQQAMKVLQNHTEKVLGKIMLTGNVKAMTYLAKSSAVPVTIARKLLDPLYKLQLAARMDHEQIKKRSEDFARDELEEEVAERNKKKDKKD